MDRKFPGESLIFLVSQPRAGSTLLQRILAAHPAIDTAAEPWLMLYPLYALREHAVTAEFGFRGFRTGLQDFLEAYGGGKATYLAAVRAWADVLYGTALHQGQGRYFLDKTPRYHLIMPDLVQVYPEARYVFLLRNPLAVLCSLKQAFLKEDYDGLWLFRGDLIDGPTNLLTGIETLGERSCVVHYEGLVTAPDETIRRVCDFLALSYSEEMLEYGDVAAPAGTFGDPVGIHQHSRPVTSSLDKWRQLAMNDQDRFFALAYLRALGPDVLERMGYSFAELEQALRANEPVDARHLIAWETMLRPPDTWTRREQLKVARARALQAYGMGFGTLRFLRENALTLVRTLIPV